MDRDRRNGKKATELKGMVDVGGRDKSLTVNITYQLALVKVRASCVQTLVIIYERAVSLQLTRAKCALPAMAILPAINAISVVFSIEIIAFIHEVLQPCGLVIVVKFSITMRHSELVYVTEVAASALEVWERTCKFKHIE